MHKINISSKKIIILILFSIFIMLCLMNFLTPLIADDFSYSFGINGRITSLYDIFEYQLHHYLTWGGRSIAHTIAQIFLMFPKSLFNIFNSAIYVSLIWLIYLIAKDNQKEKPLMLIIIHLIIWFSLPVFGQDCLWIIGSCNYLWTTVIILLFLKIYRSLTTSKPENTNWIKIILFFLLGIIAGWTNENTSAGLIVILVGYILLSCHTKKKFSLSKMQAGGLAGVITGFLILICAPGNYVRIEAFPDDTPFILKIIKRVVNITLTGEKYLLPLIVVTIILISVNIYYKNKINKEVYIYLAGGFAAMYSMALSPTFPDRAWAGIIIYLIIAVTTLLYSVESINKLSKYIIINLCIIFTIIYAKEYLEATIDIFNLRQTWEYRENEISKAKQNYQDEILFEKYITYNSKNPNYGLSDIESNPDVWPNTSIADYYNLDKVKLKDN